MGSVSVPLRHVAVLSTTAKHGSGQASADKRSEYARDEGRKRCDMEGGSTRQHIHDIFVADY